MLNFVIDGNEYTVEVVTLEAFEAEHYDDAILAGAGFTTPEGVTYVLLAPKIVA